MAIYVYNSLTKKKEELKLRQPGQVFMYVCGPTVYNYIHIGNARTFLNFDMIRRYLEFKGLKVTYVQNITDVDDKIINRAHEEKTTPAAIAKKYEQAFWQDMEALKVKKPTYAPRATETIKEMLALVEKLMAKGLAYEVEGNVYFSVRDFPAYGRLSGRTLEQMRAGERVEPEPGKRYPLDFALWKKAKSGEPYWSSPWGNGRPGWHLECSAMSLKFLGADFDIHGGAQDLIFPHHENEIAQSEGALGKRFVRYWLHAGLLNIDQEKMSKSLGNVLLLKDLLQNWEPLVVRMLMLSTHYRNPLDFTKEGLEQAKANVDKLRRTVENIEFSLETDLPESKEKTDKLKKAFSRVEADFCESMDDDFNTAGALAAIFAFTKVINGQIEAAKDLPAKSSLKEAKELLLKLLGAVGLVLAEAFGLAVYRPALQKVAAQLKPELVEKETEQILQEVINLREQARKEKNWALADKIRQQLWEAGIEIEDTPGGTRWKVRG